MLLRTLPRASLLLAVLLTGCDEADPLVPRIEALSVRPVLLRLVEGGTAQLDVEVLDGTGTFQPRADVVFGSGEPGVAGVTASGTVIARTPGWTRVWAEVDGLTDTAVVAVGLRFERLLGYCGLSSGRLYCFRTGHETHRIPREPFHGLAFDRLDGGFEFECGITTADRLYCWGDNDDLQLGVETSERCSFDRLCSTVPVEPLPTLRFRSVSTGDHHACAVTTDERLFCWGQDANGAVTGAADPCGGSWPCAMLPHEVGAYPVVAAAATHTCAIRPDRSAACWGLNNGARLGVGFQSDEILPPTTVPGGILWDTIAAGRFVTCGLDQDGRRYCWGPEREERLGLGELSESCTFYGQVLPCAMSPQSRDGEPSFVRISLSGLGCALDAAGVAHCWGPAYLRNRTGVPGEGALTVPTPVPLSAPLVDIDTRPGTCGLDETGQILCWGLFEASTRALPLDPPAGAPGLAPRGDA